MSETGRSLPRHFASPVYAVRMGMGAAEASPLSGILLRCPEDVRQAVTDQLWLRTLFVLQIRQVPHSERHLFNARADRILANLDPKDPPCPE